VKTLYIDNEKINEIRNNASIVDVISHYINVIKKGRNYMAICPFHEDHSPSLSIHSDKQIYKCFVCGNGGNVFTFVQNYEKIGFIESVSKVAELTNQELDIDITPKEKILDKNDKYYNITDEVCQYTNYLLNTTDGSVAYDYLNKRGINDTMIKMFNIGYNPINNGLYKYLNAKGYIDEDLIKLNLVRLTDYGFKDVFNSRVMFPIANKFGKVIAFSARTLQDDQAKYINTSETFLYKKGEVLYNYHRCKIDTKKQQKLIVTEGVLDVIAFARASVYNVCATLGTACTNEQLELMKELSSNIVFCYDGDKAGQNATYKTCKLALQHKINVTVINSNSELDPDEIVSKYGDGGIQDLLSKEVSWIEFLISYLQGRYNLNNYSDKKQFVLEMQEEINKLDDDFDKQNYRHQIALLTGINIELFNKNNSYVDYHENRNIDNSAFLYDGLTQAEYIVISQMLCSNQACEIYKEKLGFLINQNSNRLALIIIDEYRKIKNIDISKLIDDVKDQNQKKILISISLSEIFKSEYDEEVLKGAIESINIKLLEQKANIVKSKLKEISNYDSKIVLMNELNQILLEKRSLIDGKEKN
jgi:DNA primase